MLLQSQYTTTWVLCALVSIFLAKLLWQWRRLANIPGPFLAKVTDWQRAYWVWTRSPHEIHIDLHKRHGKLVRFGPNMVSVGDATQVDKIYKMHHPLLKVRHTQGALLFH